MNGNAELGAFGIPVCVRLLFFALGIVGVGVLLRFVPFGGEIFWTVSVDELSASLIRTFDTSKVCMY